MTKRPWILLTIGLFWLSLAVAGRSQAAPGTPTPNEVNAVAKDLWCPLCNGVRLDNCELQACVQMKEVIAQQLAAGKSEQEIRTYFIQQYGDVVTGAPAGQGFNLVAWLLPIAGAVVGLGVLAYLIFSYTRPRTARGPLTTNTPAASAPKDEYARQVDEELKRYE